MISQPISKASLARLSAELEHWYSANREPRLFWRDDDCVAVTDALDQLGTFANQLNIPILLAIIPSLAQPSLSPWLAEHRFFDPALHGYAHRNYAPSDEKKQELGHHRPISAVLKELNQGKLHLEHLLGRDLFPFLVPPWNRISSDVAGRITEIGMAGISAFSWTETTPLVPHLNCHIDLINWRDQRKAKSLVLLVDEFIAALGQARLNGYKPIGILSHHRVHETAHWLVMEDFAEFVANHTRSNWCQPWDLICA